MVRRFVHIQHGIGRLGPAGVARVIWYDRVDEATCQVVVHD